MATETIVTGAEESAAEDSETSERRPYIVVLMSADMKAAVKKYADDNDTNPTALARQLLAEKVGYDLSSEPQPSRRSVYSSDEERADAHKVASKLSGMKRKALFQVHRAQLKKFGALLLVSNRIVADLYGDAKLSMTQLETLDKELDAAIKAGK